MHSPREPPAGFCVQTVPPVQEEVEELERDQQMLVAGLGPGATRGVDWDLPTLCSYREGRCKSARAILSR